MIVCRHRFWTAHPLAAAALCVIQALALATAPSSGLADQASKTHTDVPVLSWVVSTSGSLHVINPDTGAARVVGRSDPVGGPEGGADLVRIDSRTGVAVPIGALIPESFIETHTSTAEARHIGVMSAEEQGLGFVASDVDRPPEVVTIHETQKLHVCCEEKIGQGVAVDDGIAVIGAPGADANGENAGAAYVYAKDAAGVWEYDARLLASDGAAGDWFGFDVAVHENTVVAGARFDDDYGRSSGSAYVFSRDDTDSWIEQAKLVPSEGGAYDLFGHAVAIESDTIVAGARSSAYVFVRDPMAGWSEQARLTPSADATDELYPGGVALDGNTTILGAPTAHTSNGVDQWGAAYVFVRDDSGAWSEQAKLLPSDAGGLFGIAVAIDGDTVLVGASAAESDG